jgi:hypothetical protein
LRTAITTLGVASSGGGLHGLPAAARLTHCPFPAMALTGVPSPTNRVGVSSGAESGTTPALAPLINPVVDSLVEPGVSHIEMP